MAPPTLSAHAEAGAVAVAGQDLDLRHLAVGEVATVSPSVWRPDVVVAARTGWGGDCEVIAVHGSTVPGFVGSVLPATPVWLGPLVLVVTVMWLSVAPVVGRLRTLTDAVHTGRRPYHMDGDDEIAELAAAFDQAAQALTDEVARRGRREQDLRDFVANTAHDVRIPLTVLQGHLARLEQGHDLEVLQQVVAETHYLGALLDDLAAHARMDGPRHDSPVDLVEVVQRVVRRHAPVARRAGIALSSGTPDEALVIPGDLTLLEQALSNLVFNAIHHHQRGGHVAVTLDTTDADGFELCVVDDGPGVPEAELARLTERGFRGSAARSRDDRGSGLGLAIVARVAERHGLVLDVRNRAPSTDEAGAGATGLVCTLRPAREPQDAQG